MGVIDFLCRPLSLFQPGESVQSSKWLSAEALGAQRGNVFVAFMPLVYVLEHFHKLLQTNL